MRQLSITAFSLGGFFVCSAADAGFMPVVINLKAQTTGTIANNTPPAFFLFDVPQGDYTATLVNDILGHPDFHADADFTAWSVAFGNAGSWITAYRVRYEDDSVVFSGGIGNPGLNGQADAQAAFDFAVAQSAQTFSFNVPFEQNLAFEIVDIPGSYFDNREGVSILLEPVAPSAVPEPSTLVLLMIGGLVLLCCWAGRRRWPILQA